MAQNLLCYFSNKIQKGKTCYSEEQVISMDQWQKDNVLPKQVPVTNYEVNSSDFDQVA
jgi:hypothetical protein